MSKPSVTRADFARIMGVDRSAVTRWVQRGMPVLDDGDINPVAGADWVRATVDTYKIRGSVGARQMAAAERNRWLESVVVAYSIGDEMAAYYAAELLLPHLPEPTVRAVVEKLLHKMQVGSVESLDDDYAPPSGCTTWAEDPRFQKTGVYGVEWQELLEDLAAGKLDASVDVQPGGAA